MTGKYKTKREKELSKINSAEEIREIVDATFDRINRLEVEISKCCEKERREFEFLYAIRARVDEMNRERNTNDDAPTGKWIKDEDMEYYTCSNCGIQWVFIDESNGSKFCPECGADMRGEE